MEKEIEIKYTAPSSKVIEVILQKGLMEPSVYGEAEDGQPGD